MNESTDVELLTQEKVDAAKVLVEKAFPYLKALFPDGKWVVRFLSIEGGSFSLEWIHGEWMTTFLSFDCHTHITVSQGYKARLSYRACVLGSPAIGNNPMGEFDSLEEAIAHVGNIGHALTTAEQTAEALKARFAPEVLL